MDYDDKYTFKFYCWKCSGMNDLSMANNWRWNLNSFELESSKYVKDWSESFDVSTHRFRKLFLKIQGYWHVFTFCFITNFLHAVKNFDSLIPKTLSQFFDYFQEILVKLKSFLQVNTYINTVLLLLDGDWGNLKMIKRIGNPSSYKIYFFLRNLFTFQDIKRSSIKKIILVERVFGHETQRCDCLYSWSWRKIKNWNWILAVST